MNNKPHSEETKRKISLSLKGHTLSKFTKQQLLKANLGVPRSEEIRKKISVSMKGLGAAHHNWKGGITDETEKIRKSIEYRLWREAVFARDNWECQECHNRSREGQAVVLNADHIKPFALFPELRFAIDNGRTLCVPCHRKTDTFGFKLINRRKNQIV